MKCYHDLWLYLEGQAIETFTCLIPESVPSQLLTAHTQKYVLIHSYIYCYSIIRAVFFFSNNVRWKIWNGRQGLYQMNYYIYQQKDTLAQQCTSMDNKDWTIVMFFSLENISIALESPNSFLLLILTCNKLCWNTLPLCLMLKIDFQYMI